MMNQLATCRTLLAASLAVAGLSAGAQGQDIYKSQAEMLNAAAANKQADAAIIGAMATYGKAEAEASKLHQEIREKAAQNELLETETYYQKRAQYHAYHETQRPAASSPERHAERARRAAGAQLTSYHWDHESGNLHWPTLLKTTAYDPFRRRIDDLLENRTLEDSGAGSQNCVKTMSVVNALKAVLRDNIRRYTVPDYLAVRRFLDGVALEARRPTGIPRAETLDRVADR
jgi:hypothetical protein